MTVCRIDRPHTAMPDTVERRFTTNDQEQWLSCWQCCGFARSQLNHNHLVCEIVRPVPCEQGRHTHCLECTPAVRADQGTTGDLPPRSMPCDVIDLDN